MKLRDRVALVTGGSRGIGRGISLALAGAGAGVAVNYVRDETAARDVVQAIQSAGGDAWAIQADVSQRPAVGQMVEGVIARAGRLDILVNNAGIGGGAPFLELSEETWDRVLAVNLKGIFNCSQAAARHMVQHGGGSIVNITSICGSQVWVGSVAYHASKAGADHLTRAMAAELAPLGIRVNGIAPGSVETDMLRHDVAVPGEMEALIGRTPAGRLGAPADIGRAVVYLCTEADWMVGNILSIDGGYLLVGDPLPPWQH